MAPMVAHDEAEGLNISNLVFVDLEERISAISEEDAMYRDGERIDLA
jgi:pantocin A family RiPP